MLEFSCNYLSKKSKPLELSLHSTFLCGFIRILSSDKASKGRVADEVIKY